MLPATPPPPPPRTSCAQLKGRGMDQRFTELNRPESLSVSFRRPLWSRCFRIYRIRREGSPVLKMENRYPSKHTHTRTHAHTRTRAHTPPRCFWQQLLQPMTSCFKLPYSLSPAPSTPGARVGVEWLGDSALSRARFGEKGAQLSTLRREKMV